MTAAASMTRAQFARALGVSRVMVTKLGHAGRLVEEGRRVRVAETLERIADTSDPSRDGKLADAAKRLRAEAAPAPVALPEAPTLEGASTYQEARAVKERFLALQAKHDYELATGTILKRAEVNAAMARAGALLRAQLETLPDQLAPAVLEAREYDRIHALMVEEVERILGAFAEACRVAARHG